MVTRNNSVPDLIRELTDLLLLPETPVEAVECAKRVIDQIAKCILVVWEAPSAARAGDGTLLFQGSDPFVEFVAAVRARDWHRVAVCERGIRDH
jgi:hypothetical protein